MEVQVFGYRKSAATRKALRFFAERRIRTHFVDLHRRPPSPGELRRFIQRFGAAGLVDRDSRRFRELGLAHSQLSEERWAARLAEAPEVLRLPLVRWRQRLSVGEADDEWRRWLEAGP